MNPNLCRLALRPRGPLEVFDLCLRLIRAHPSVFGRLAALVVLPVALGTGLGAWLTGGHWVWLLVPVLAGPLLQAPFTLLGGRLLFSDAFTVRQVLRELLQRPLALLAVPFWVLLVEAVGVLSCGAGLILLPAMAFVTEAALLERADGSRIPSRAAKLAGLHPGIAVAAVLGWGTLTIWGGLVGEGAGQALVGSLLQIGRPFGSLSDGMVTPYLLAGALLAQPLFAVYRLLLFVDVRTRVDAWDLQVGLRAAGLAATSPGDPGQASSGQGRPGQALGARP